MNAIKPHKIEVCDYNPSRIIQECVLGQTFWQCQELFGNCEVHRKGFLLRTWMHVWKGWRVANGFPAASTTRKCRWSFTIWKRHVAGDYVANQGAKDGNCEAAWVARPTLCLSIIYMYVCVYIYICVFEHLYEYVHI